MESRRKTKDGLPDSIFRSIEYCTHTHLDKFYDSRVVIVRLDEAKINTRTFPFRLRFYSTLQLRQTASPVSRKRVSERERERRRKTVNTSKEHDSRNIGGN